MLEQIKQRMAWKLLQWKERRAKRTTGRAADGLLSTAAVTPGGAFLWDPVAGYEIFTPERFRSPVDLRAWIAAGRLGRKSGRGFYVYGGGAKRRVDPAIYDALPGGAVRKRAEVRAIQERLLGAFTGEAQRCLSEGVIRSPRDGDIGAVFGLGFPPFLGGPFFRSAGRS